MTLCYTGNKPKNCPNFVKSFDTIEGLVSPIPNSVLSKKIKETKENGSKERIGNSVSGFPLTPSVSDEEEKNLVSEEKKEPSPEYVGIKKRYHL